MVKLSSCMKPNKKVTPGGIFEHNNFMTTHQHYVTSSIILRRPISPYTMEEERNLQILDGVLTETSPACDLGDDERFKKPVLYHSDMSRYTRVYEPTGKRLRKPPYVVTKPSNGQQLQLTETDLMNLAKWFDNNNINKEFLQRWPDLFYLIESTRIKMARKKTLRKRNK